MHPERFSELKRRYGFDRWSAAQQRRAQLFFWNYRLFGSAIPTWTVVSNRYIPLPTGVGLNRAVIQAPLDPRWTLLLDIYECGSNESARELLIDLLGHYQTPVPFAPELARMADVEFAAPADSTVLQVIGNLVIHCQNAARVAAAPVRPLVDALATDLVGSPRRAPMEADASPAGDEQDLGQSAVVGEPLALDFDPTARTAMRASAESESYLKVVVGNGNVRVHENELVYVPDEAGRIGIEVFVVTPTHVTMRRYRLGVRST